MEVAFMSIRIGRVAAGCVGADPTREVRNLRPLRWVGGVLRARDELRAAVAATHGQ
jgi:hypothetical protein